MFAHFIVFTCCFFLNSLGVNSYGFQVIEHHNGKGTDLERKKERKLNELT